MTGGPVIGVVGLGTMGLGIAQVFAVAGFEVLGTDGHVPAQETAAQRIETALQARVAAGKLTAADAAATMSRFAVRGSIGGLAPCDLVIEAIVENLEAKQALFAALEAILAPDALLATNTSSLSVQQIARHLRRPERCLALHFFNPPPAMKLVELVPHAGTSAAAQDKARDLCRAAGKVVVSCPDRPGFIVNRVARPYYGEALALLQEGHPAAAIDAAMQGAGYRLGPFALIDLIGADINLAATLGLWGAMGQHPRYQPFDALRAQVAKGDLGRKSGKGFVFGHPPDPACPPALPDAAAQFVLRIESLLINEAFWLLGEGGTQAQGIDTAMQLGLNFPRGPFAALALHGKAAVLGELARLQRDAPAPMKPRYAPAPELERS